MIYSKEEMAWAELACHRAFNSNLDAILPEMIDAGKDKDEAIRHLIGLGKAIADIGIDLSAHRKKID